MRKPYVRPSHWHHRACWLELGWWAVVVWDVPEVCFAGGRLSLVGMLQQALATPVGNSINTDCLMGVLDGKPTGYVRSPGKHRSSKAEGCTKQVSKYAYPLRLWMWAPSEKHKCLIPREWLLVIIIKRALKSPWKSASTKLCFEKLSASQGETWIEILPLHTHSFKIFYF